MARYEMDDIAKDLIEDHAGIPNLNVARELCESFSRVIRKRLIKDGVVTLDETGKLYIKMIKGTVKYNPQNQQKYKMSDRCVVSFKAIPSMNKLINMNRTAPVKV